MLINVALDYSNLPGGRYESQGSYSGERFRDEFLYPKFIEAINNDEVLIVNLDGGYGYGSGFLEESFGGLVRKLIEEESDYSKEVFSIIIISEDNPGLIDDIYGYMFEALNNYNVTTRNRRLKK